MTRQRGAVFQLVLAMLIFGTLGVFVRNIALPSSVIALARASIGMVFLLIVIAVRRQKPDGAAIRRNALWLLGSGACLGFNWILLFESYRYTTVAMGTLCYYMSPILVILVSPLLLRERLSVKKLICVIAALGGMVCLSGVVGSGIPAAGELRGILLGLAAAVLYTAIVLMNKQLEGISSNDRTVVQLGISAVILTVYCLLSADVDPAVLTPLGIGLLIFVGVVHTGVAYWLYFGAVGDLPGQSVAIISYVDPVVAVLASVVILHESMSAAEAVGAVLILGAAMVSELHLPKREKHE